MDEGKNVFATTLGKNIRCCREAKGWTLEEMARRCGYTSKNSRSTIQKIESGTNDIPASRLKKIADVLGTTPANLMDYRSAVESSPAPELTEREQNLVEDFRSLNNQGQEYILQTMDMAVRIYKNDYYFSDLENEA